MKNVRIIGLIPFLICCACTNKPQLNSLEISTKITPEEYIRMLDSLDYFHMTPKNELDSSKIYLLNMFKDLRFFDGKPFYDSIYNVDYRFYVLDGEELYEEGGLITYINDLTRTFAKLGIPIKHKNEDIRITPDSLYHSIEINGSVYVAYNGKHNEYSWSIAAYKFAEMLNSELEKHGSRERIYLINSENDGRLVFLTEEIYEFVRKVIPVDDDTPMEVQEWARYHGLEKHLTMPS